MMCCFSKDFFSFSLPNELIAAFVGGSFVLIGVWGAHFFEVRRQNQQKREMIHAFLQGIHDEIDTLWLQYMATMGDILEKIKIGVSLEYYYPIGEDYFAFYHANLDKVGEIKDPNLRRLIVETYSRAKGFVDSFKMNNNLVKQLEEYSNPESYNHQYLKAHKVVMSEYGSRLKQGHFELKDKIQKLLLSIAIELEI